MLVLQTSRVISTVKIIKNSFISVSIKTTPKEVILLLKGDIKRQNVGNTIYMIIEKYVTTIIGENCIYVNDK